MRPHQLLPALILVSGLFSSRLQSQTPDEESYQIYLEQVTQMLRVRGLDNNEIRNALAVYRENNISSDRNFATLLNKLYPLEKGVLIIYFNYHGDTLRRVIFEPGAIRETKNFPIRSKELFQLGTDFNFLLGLVQEAGNRSPAIRGAIVNPPPPTKGLSYDSLVRKASRLLLPEWFDKTWKHLIIIPALNIGTLPFQLLQPYGDSSLLVEHCCVSIAPSAGDLVALRMKVLKQATNWNGRLELPFNYTTAAKKMDSVRFNLDNPLFISNPLYPDNTMYSFPNLPGAKKEIDNALSYAKNYVLLEGRAARKDSVLKYIPTADLVYFATHGIASEEDPMHKSFLVLSGTDPFLTAKDIMDSRKQFNKFPEMVILSACQTGLGRSMEAGVAGLARAFMLAGANHVIMSLWNVDDEATAYLMNRFLYHLQNPSPFLPAEPLRKAMLDTREKFPKPSQWAGFSLFGVDY